MWYLGKKFDHMASVTNFIILPLTFLSGTFYSVAKLPEEFRFLAFWNPFFISLMDLDMVLLEAVIVILFQVF